MLDLTMQAIQTSLDGLAARQRIDATNLANSETPGYTAQTVNFEDSLSSAIANGDPTQAQITTGVTSDPPNINGNNVSVDTETIAMIDTGLEVPARDAGDEQQVPHSPRLDEAGPLMSSMFPTFDIASSALTTHQIWMNAIADNIANINTVKPMSQAAYQEKFIVAQEIPSAARASRSVSAAASRRSRCSTATRPEWSPTTRPTRSPTRTASCAGRRRTSATR